MVIDLKELTRLEAVKAVMLWFEEQTPEVLNIAGSRESVAPGTGIYRKGYRMLRETLGGKASSNTRKRTAVKHRT